MKNLQGAILDELAEDMQKSMDFDILCDVLTSFGWTRLEVDYGRDQRWVDVKEWAAQNFEQNHQEHNGSWLIESSKDATMFALKWRCD